MTLGYRELRVEGFPNLLKLCTCMMFKDNDEEKYQCYYHSIDLEGLGLLREQVFGLELCLRKLSARGQEHETGMTTWHVGISLGC